MILLFKKMSHKLYSIRCYVFTTFLHDRIKIDQEYPAPPSTRSYFFARLVIRRHAHVAIDRRRERSVTSFLLIFTLENNKVFYFW